MSVSTPTRAQRAERHLMRVRGAGKLARDINRDIFSFSISAASDSGSTSSIKRRKLHHDATMTSNINRATKPAHKHSSEGTSSTPERLSHGKSDAVPSSSSVTASNGSQIKALPSSMDSTATTTSNQDPVKASQLPDAKALAKAQARARAAKLFAESNANAPSTRAKTKSQAKMMAIFKDPPLSVADTAQRPTTSNGPGSTASKSAPRSFEVFQSSETNVTSVSAPQPQDTILAVSDQAELSAKSAPMATAPRQPRRSARARPAVVPILAATNTIPEPKQDTTIQQNTTKVVHKPTRRIAKPAPRVATVVESKHSVRPAQPRTALSSINPNKDLKKPVLVDDKPKKISAEALLRQKIKLIADYAVAGAQKTDNLRGTSTQEKSSAESPIFDAASLMSFASRHHIKTVIPAKGEKHDPEKLMLSSTNRQGSIASRKRTRDEQEDMDVDDLITNITTLTKGVEKRFSQDLSTVRNNKSCTFR